MNCIERGLGQLGISAVIADLFAPLFESREGGLFKDCSPPPGQSVGTQVKIHRQVALAGSQAEVSSSQVILHSI